MEDGGDVMCFMSFQRGRRQKGLLRPRTRGLEVKMRVRASCEDLSGEICDSPQQGFYARSPLAARHVEAQNASETIGFPHRVFG